VKSRNLRWLNEQRVMAFALTGPEAGDNLGAWEVKYSAVAYSAGSVWRGSW
jgi:hypothetical protein